MLSPYRTIVLLHTIAVALLRATTMLRSRCEAYIQEHCLIAEGERVVVAVSGGMDSVVLLDLLLALAPSRRMSIIVAHVNHRLRGKASDADEAFVRGLCGEHHIPCEVLRRSPKGCGNLQDAARRMRAGFFEDVARRCGARCIATAHHRNDQAETVLLHLLRGTGMGGLCGIRPMVEMDGMARIRPLLFAGRCDIEAHARRRRLAYREDASNATSAYARNRIRHEVLPQLARINPRIAESLAALAERIAADDDALAHIAREAVQEALHAEDGRGIVLRRGVYAHLPTGIRRRMVREAFARASGSTADLNADQVEKIDAIAVGGKSRGEYRLRAPWKFFRAGELLSIRCVPTSCDRETPHMT